MSTSSASLSLNLVVLRAENPERLCQFYGALGLQFVLEQHGTGPVHHASDLGSSVLEIYPRRAHEPASTGTRIGFRVPSLDSALNALSSESAGIVQGPVATSWGRRAVVCDPEGHKVELVERTNTTE